MHNKILIIPLKHNNLQYILFIRIKILEKIYIYINQEVQQGCNLSLALFNTYIDDLRNWKYKVDAGIALKRNRYLNTLLFADDQIIKQNTEDKLQKMCTY